MAYCRRGLRHTKQKSTLERRLRGYVEWQLEHYRENKLELDRYWHDMTPSATPNYSSEPVSGGDVSRKTEDVVMRISNIPYIRQLERSCKAIERVLARADETDRKLIDLVYWRREFTPEGAAMVLHMGKSSAYRHINTILTKIASELGFISIPF